MAVEPGGDEEPELEEDDRGRQEEPGEGRHLHIEEERPRQPGEGQLVARLHLERDAMQDMTLAVMGVHVLDADERRSVCGQGAHVLR